MVSLRYRVTGAYRHTRQLTQKLAIERNPVARVGGRVHAVIRSALQAGGRYLSLIAEYSTPGNSRIRRCVMRPLSSRMKTILCDVLRSVS